MAAVMDRDLQLLLAPFAGEGMFLSCYAANTVAEGFRPDWIGPFETKADALRKSIGEEGRVRSELELNLHAIRRVLESPVEHSAREHSPRWITIFSSIRRDFLHVIRLDVPVESDLVLDRSPYLVPLLKAMQQRREYLVVQADTHRGRLFSASRRKTAPRRSNTP